MVYSSGMDIKGFNLFSLKKVATDSDADTTSGVFLPSQRRLGSCMTHRSDILWIDSTMKKDEILHFITAHPEFSLFPVCSNTVDSVLGVLPARVFLASLLEPVWPGIKSLLKKPVYVPETVTILKTFLMMDEVDCRMAFIIDEYGGIEGMVTRNGIISELLEEISDQEQDDDPDIFRRDDGSYLVGGQVRMDEIRDQFTLPDAEGSHEYYTLAGYILSINGSIPKTGDRIIAGNYICEIVDMDGHRIDKVLVMEKPPKSGEKD